MKRLQHFVNLLFFPLHTHLHVLFREGPNYSKRQARPQGLFRHTAQPAIDHSRLCFTQPVAMYWLLAEHSGKVMTSINSCHFCI